MYVPEHAREERREVLIEAIEAIRFGTLVTVVDDRPVLTHLPMFVQQQGDALHIVGHISRANPQWKQCTRRGVASFAGGNYYVSPSLYASKAVHGKVVPTWNYIAVEAQGVIEFFDDAKRLLRLVDELTTRQEASRTDPWSVHDAPNEYIQKQLLGIVGFQLAVSDLVGAWKLGRNKTNGDRDGLLTFMRTNDNPRIRELADEM